MWWKRYASSSARLDASGATSCLRLSDAEPEIDLGLEALGHELADGVRGEDLPDDRRRLDDRALVAARGGRAARRAAPGSWAAPRRGRSRPRRATRRPRSGSRPRRSASRAAARRTAGCPRRPRRSGAVPARRDPASPSRCCDDRAGLVGGQALERDALRASPVDQSGRVSTSSWRAVQTTSSGDVVRRLDQVLDEVEERRLGPVDVLESTTTSGRGGERSRGACAPPEQLLHAGSCADESPIADATRSTTSSFPPRGARELRASAASAESSLSDPGGLAHDLGDRPERDAVPVRKAAPADDGARSRDRPDELLDEARLADARLADDRHEPAAPVRDRAPRRAPREALQLGLAADHRRVQPAAGARRRSRTPSSRYAGTRSAFPFSSSGSTGSTSTWSRTSRYVSSPSSTSLLAGAPARGAPRR